MGGDTLPFSRFQFNYHATDKPTNKQCKHTESQAELGGWVGRKTSFYTFTLKKQETRKVDLNAATDDLEHFRHLDKKKSEDVDI